MAKGDGGNEQGNGKGTSRSRWATRKLTVKSSGLKRTSILGRKHKGSDPTEKKRQSGVSDNQTLEEGHDADIDDAATATANDQTDAKSTTSSSDDQGRTLFFNQPLPPEFKDEEGNPINSYARNKIRTAKYTPLSFIPKNLWFQFHNVANIFFLFLVILVVSQILMLLCLIYEYKRSKANTSSSSSSRSLGALILASMPCR